MYNKIILMGRIVADPELKTPQESAEMPIDNGEIVVDDTTPVNEEPPAVEPESASDSEEYPFPNE